MLAAADPWVRWDWVERHTDKIWAATRQHIELTLIAVTIGLLLSLPLGVLAHRWRRLQSPLLAFAGILYTVPSLALFGFLVPITGLSRLTSEIGLVSYTLLILIRNVVTGLEGVPADAREAAQGMGYGSWRQLRSIEIPLALPAILAGVRIATVTTIGLVTVTAVIGQGGLGELMFQEGFEPSFRTPLVVGLVLSVGLAVVADGLLRVGEALLTPWSRAR